MVAEIVIPVLVPTPLIPLLLIVELVLFLHCPFHIDCVVIYVFVRGVMSYEHSLLEPRVKPGLEPIHS